MRLIASALALTVWTAPGTAQNVRLSQHGRVTQRIGDTEITVDYNRPVARGRTLFGGRGAVVRHGRLWHPGANEATTIEFSTGVLVEDHPVPAGRYSLWVTPQPESWEFILSRRADVWHTRYPGEAEDALRFTVTPEEGAFMETLIYYFPVVEPDAAILRLHWGTVIAPIRISIAH